jgi:CheY-like chemotaxis protein
MADPTQIHQIIMNLVTNAFHAMEKDGGTLTIGLNEVVLDSTDLIDPTMKIGKYVRLTINDTGIGMDKATLGRIFESYFSTKETGKGTGLGLSVVHGILKGYGGNNKAYAEPFKGSSVNVLLPVFEDAVADSKSGNNIDIVGGDEKVHIVDDDTHILNMIQHILERLGYKFTARMSSIVALDDFRLAPNDYDFVITDMTMPKNDRFTTFRGVVEDKTRSASTYMFRFH